MIKTNGPGLFLPASDCALLDKALRDALRFGWLGRHAVPPHALVVLAEMVHETAEEYRPPEYRRSPVTCGTGTASTSDAQPSTSFEATSEVLLTTTEAALELGVTESYVRRLARKSALRAERSASGGWRFPRRELDAFDACRRETEQKGA